MDIFCKIINGEIPSNCPFENEFVKCIMDANPNSPGHLLILPKKHYEDALEMDEETLKEIHKTAQMMINKMMAGYEGIDGVVMIVNYGKPQIIKHYHLHLVPTYHENEPTMSQEEACEILKK